MRRQRPSSSKDGADVSLIAADGARLDRAIAARAVTAGITVAPHLVERSSRVGCACPLWRFDDRRVRRAVAARHAIRLVAGGRRADDGGDGRRAGRVGRHRASIPSGGASAHRPDRHDCPDVGVAPRDRASRGRALRDPDRRRERERQGARGQGDSPFRPQTGPAVLHAQLRRAPRRSHRGGVVRARARRVYRRGERARGRLRGSAWRDALSRRNRRAVAARASQAASGDSGRRAAPDWRKSVAARRRAHRIRHESQPAAGGFGGAVSARSSVSS